MKKTVMVLAIFSFSLSAQTNNDHQFGFNIGINYSNAFVSGTNLGNVDNGVGFRVGVLMHEALSPQLSIVPKIELSFNNCSFSYATLLEESTHYIYASNLDIPLHIHYCLNKKGTAPYLIIGPNLRLPLADQEGKAFLISPKNCKDRPDAAIDLGFGFAKAHAYFNLAPEFRYSIGLLNVSNRPGVDKVYFHNLSVILNFRG